VWIHGLIRRQFTAEAAGARYPNSIECQYLIDYGIQGESLPVEAYSRQFTVGTIVFAPETGPIFSNERIGVDASLETTEGWEYNELTLLPSELPPPDRRAPAASLENIWPNADGDSWSYASDVVYGPTSRVNDPEAPLPSMSELYDWLHGSSEIDSVAVSERGYLGLQFDGMKTTESGATGQNLAETLRLPVESVLRSYEVEAGTTFLSALLRARPDLEEAARRLYPASMGALEGQKRVILSDVMPLFLSGGAWEKTGQYIGSYGDVDQQLAWKYLESNLTPGHSFSFQLVPSLAEDVWLHVQVWRRLDFTLGEQGYRNCIEVLYALDFGIQVQVDEGGQTIGRYHSYAAGTLIYAPGVGPVQVLERELLAAPTPMGLDRNATLVEARVLESPMP
jgi:hypothetical protein